MLLGPVFNAELVTAARRRRNYVIRFVYGIVLLYFVGTNGPAYSYRYDASITGEFSHQQLAEIGRSLFSTFLIVQSITVLLMTPALVAGVIADEKQRKTLHYLLGSSLSSFEIIVGKLASRMLQLGVLVLSGLPILSLIGLFGGVDPLHILLSFVATLTTAFFLSTLSILISVQAKRPREAISLVYLLEAFWLAVPTMIQFLMPMGGAFWSWVYEWLRPVNQWFVITSPLNLVMSAQPISRLSTSSGLAEIAWMCGVQMVFAILFLASAVLTLRPIFRRQGESTRSKASLLTRRGRFMARPECGDDPMMWKERYVSRTSLVTKVIAFLIGFASVRLLAFFTFDSFALAAFRELASGSGSMQARNNFNGYLRAICTILYALWAIALASAASGGLTSEREEDTWISLISTPLSGLEIIRAKLFGAFWGLRWIGFVVLALWLLGVASGAVHPIGLILILIETVIFLSFANALGTYLSLRSSRSSQALLATLGILIVVNGGYLLCCIPLQPSTVVVGAGVTPMVEAFSLISYSDIEHVLDGAGSAYGTHRDYGEAIFLCFLSALIYAAAAIALILRAIDRFDSVVDRPRRRVLGLPPRPNLSEPANKAAGAGVKKERADDEIAT